MTPDPFTSNVLLFGRVLRGIGLEVHHGRMLDAIRALEWVGVRHRSDVRATLRALLVHRHEDLTPFDEAFDLFFRAHAPHREGLPLYSLGERPRLMAKPPKEAAASLEAVDIGHDRSSGPMMAIGVYSPAEISRTKDFAEFTTAELEQARRLLARLPWELGLRRTRRWAGASGNAVDMRRVLRRNLMRSDEIFDLPRRRRQLAPRPLVLIGDVSGSMDRYSRMLLHFIYGLTDVVARVESFVFATRLTRVTRRLAERGKTRVIDPLIASVQDWGGGTRIGEALRTFNTHWARRVMRNGPVVLIVSDGWDRGDPLLLAGELARIHRSCRRLIWLNPLLGSANYEPLTRGMQAALRHVDDFMPVHNLLSLEQLAEHLRALPGGRNRVGSRVHRC
jgi:hypothetical protein